MGQIVIPTVPGTGISAASGFNDINLMFAELYGDIGSIPGLVIQVAANTTAITGLNTSVGTLNTEVAANTLSISQLLGSTFSTILTPTGSATLDQNALSAALALLATSGRVPFGASDFYMTGVLTFAPGTFFYTAQQLLTASGKMSGLWFKGAGYGGVTSFDFNPSVTGLSMFVNQDQLALRFSDLQMNSHDPTSDVIWHQEQKSVTNIQDYLDENVGYFGFRRIKRLTGGNNNSEHKMLNCYGSACAGPWIYTPGPITCSITSGNNFITMTNLNADMQVGDTAGFSASVAPMLSTLAYNVVAVTQPSGGTPGTFQISTTPTGTPITFTASGTPTSTNSSDQFLNFSFEGLTKWWNAQGPLVQLNVGGHVVIDKLDASSYGPTSPCTFVASSSATTLTIASITTGALNTGMLLECATGGTQIVPGTTVGALLTGTGGAGSTWAISPSQTIAASTALQVVVPIFQLLGQQHAGGVEVFECRKMRIEYTNDVGRGMFCQWLAGNIEISVDESSQVGSRNANNLNWLFQYPNNCGATVLFRSSQLAGKHAYAYSTNNFNFIYSINYLSCKLLQAADVSAFMVAGTDNTNGNIGGIPWADFQGTQKPGSSTGTFKYALDCTWNYYLAYGAVTKRRSANLLSSQSMPINGTTSTGLRFPLNAIGAAINISKLANANTGAYAFNIQTTEATPTVLATISGANAALAFSQSVQINFLMNTDLARTIVVVDTQTRTTAFGNTTLDMEYRG